MDDIKNENDELQSPTGVSKDTVELGVKLLLKLISSKPKDQEPERPNEFISLIVTLKSRMTPSTPQYIPVPHPLCSIDGSQGACLIIGVEKEGLNAEVAESKIKEKGLPISKVFQFSKFKADYRKPKDSKKLFMSFGLLVASKSVFPKVSKFYDKSIRNHLIPVDLTLEGLTGELESACSLTTIFNKHSSCVAEVGRVSQTSKEIVENIVAVIDKLVSEIPEKWNNISCMHLKSLGSLCPLYESFTGKVGKGGLPRNKRTKHPEHTPDAKRKKGLSSEGKAGSFNGLGVGDGVPKDGTPAASGLEMKNKLVDLHGGVVANSVKAKSKKKKFWRKKKSSVKAV